MCPISEPGARATLQSALPGYLQAQRWFGGKGRRLASATIVDASWTGAGAGADGLVFVEASYDDASPERYVVWLGLRAEAGSRTVVGRSPEGLYIVDVSDDPDSARALLGRLGRAMDLATTGGGSIRFTDVTAAAADRLRGTPEVRPIGADQSNTSIGVDDMLVFKLFRRQLPGENPEVEIGRVLTSKTSFRHLPPLHGSATYWDPGGTPHTLGVLQGWVPNSGDGWRYVQGWLAAELASPGSWRTAQGDLFTLGAVTAAFHHASASVASDPAFAPEPVVPSTIRGWTTAVRDQAARAVHQVPDSRLAEPARTRLLQALVRLADRETRLDPSVESLTTSFHCVRVHGDYHLGQTLKTTDGFVLIDFEGEPSRSIEERRRKQCALKDVAGMLRSFEYALAVACRTVPDRLAGVRARLAMAPAFLDGYVTSAGSEHAAFIPSDGSALAAWIRFFEIEKALYELDYELNNRPDWADIPALGLLDLLDG